MIGSPERRKFRMLCLSDHSMLGALHGSSSCSGVIHSNSVGVSEDLREKYMPDRKDRTRPPRRKPRGSAPGIINVEVQRLMAAYEGIPVVSFL